MCAEKPSALKALEKQKCRCCYAQSMYEKTYNRFPFAFLCVLGASVVPLSGCAAAGFLVDLGEKGVEGVCWEAPRQFAARLLPDFRAERGF